MATPADRPHVPPAPAECLSRAEYQLLTHDSGEAIAWALIAIAAELGAIRRELRKGR
ncbi:hypothetical protein OG264_16090 [Streptomyces xanthophaeus]|uniref:hypothetical protein n=1 Tax=Streptomyces xanthophaeus TaxID=67385 RepID=UPI00386711AC|nr:hypothetical protein OG264_16090 [Streptomyces xanthophaeus]WST62145.1 hypothetical protein OG605_22345 [Streptomyces xanthophaeus]